MDGEANDGDANDRQRGPLVGCERRAAPVDAAERKALVDGSTCGVPSLDSSWLTMHADHGEVRQEHDP
jgi:hypothetical protein